MTDYGFSTEILTADEQYVFVQMVLDDDTWRAVKNVPSVSGFAASNSETGRPLPMPDDEVEQLIKEEELGQATSLPQSGGTITKTERKT